MYFDEETLRVYDEWLSSPVGRYIDQREKFLIERLLKPQAGERLLDVGCGRGHHLAFFKEKGCDVTGIEPSRMLLDAAQERLGRRTELYPGTLDNLPFSDNEFDVVTMICSLDRNEFPREILAEAMRVCRDRIFLGLPNQFSLCRGRGTAKNPMLSAHSNPTVFFNIMDIKYMIRSVAAHAPITWGSVIFFPLHWYSFAMKLDALLPVIKNPFGSFIGAAFPMVITHRTLQDPLRETPQLNMVGSRQVTGAVREMKP